MDLLRLFKANFLFKDVLRFIMSRLNVIRIGLRPPGWIKVGFSTGLRLSFLCEKWFTFDFKDKLCR